jgi:hypothetical protein
VRVQAAFDACLAELQNKNTPKVRRARRTEAILREAWTAELWDDRTAAILAYEKLREHLAEPVGGASWAKDKRLRNVESRVQSFLVHRLGRLESR